MIYTYGGNISDEESVGLNTKTETKMPTVPTVEAEKNIESTISKPENIGPVYTYGGRETINQKSGNGISESGDTFRNLIQVPLGLAKKATIPLDFYKAWVIGEGLSEIDDLKERFPNFDEESYRKSLSEAVDLVPTQSSLEEFVESKLGIPLTPKTPTQESIRSGAEMATFMPGGVGTKIAAGVLQPNIKSGLKSSGVPDIIADPSSQILAGGTSILGNLALGKAGRMATKALGGKAVEKTADEIAREAVEKTAGKVQPLKVGGVPRRAGPITGAKPSTGSDLNIELPKLETPQSVRQEIGKSISPIKHGNTTEGGQRLISEVSKIDEATYKDVNNAYKIAKTKQAGISEIQPELVDSIVSRLKELEFTPHLSPQQSSLKESLERVLNMSSRKIERGRVLSPKLKEKLIKNGLLSKDGKYIYKKIPNKSLIDQITNLHERADYDFAHGSKKNVVKPFILDLKKAVSTTAEKYPEANKALEIANKKYADWADTFDNDYMRPLRDKRNKDFSKTYQRSLDLDEFNMVNKVLSKSEKGKEIAGGIKRDLVNKRLQPFFEDIKKTLGHEFEDTLNELSAVLSPKEIASIKRSMRMQRKMMGARFTDLITIQKSKAERLKDYITKPENLIKAGRLAGAGAATVEAAKLASELSGI